MRTILPTMMTMFALVSFAPSRALADHVIMSMELMGSLIEDKSGQFYLLVDGQMWSLELERWQVEKARESRKNPNGKVTVHGGVQVTLLGQNLILKNRTVKVSSIKDAIPTVVVKMVVPGSPAAKSGVLVGDHLVKIKDRKDEEDPQPELKNEEDLRRVLKKNRGKEVTIFIIRQRDRLTIDNVQLRTQDTNILGAVVEIVWRSEVDIIPSTKVPSTP